MKYFPALYAAKAGFTGDFARDAESLTAGVERQAVRKSVMSRNAAVGGFLALFSVSVYLYSMWAVKQEDFSDLDEHALKERELEEKKLLSGKKA